jgi:uncharacterized membrane protein
MTREELYGHLNDRYHILPERERQRIIRFYDDLFEKALAEGRTEREVMEALGYPEEPASSPVSRFFSQWPARFKRSLVRCALGGSYLIFVFGPWAFVFTLFLVIGTLSLSLVLSPFALLYLFIEPAPVLMHISTGAPLLFFLSMLLLGLGLWIGWFALRVTRRLSVLTRQYVQSNRKLIRDANSL